MSRSDLEAVRLVFDKATAPEDVFGHIADTATLTKAWHKLAAVVHPDKYASSPADVAAATDLLSRLNDWKAKAEAKLASGTYGNGAPHVDVPKAAPIVVETSKRRYVLSETVGVGDVADLYACTFDGGTEAVFKVAMSAADNDLLENEAKVLRRLQGDGGFHRYVPKLLDSLVVRGVSGSAGRRANVIKRAFGYVTLADVIHKYPAGLDYRDAAWMFKRMLAGAGFAHREGFVHGAILPTHVMVHPTRHGCKLIDWCYSVPTGGKVVAVSKAYKGWYPPEVLAKKPATAQTDIYMVARCAGAIIGDTRAPESFHTFLASCLIPNPSKRPDDAWALHEELDELLRRLVGKQSYRPLTI